MIDTTCYMKIGHSRVRAIRHAKAQLMISEMPDGEVEVIRRYLDPQLSEGCVTAEHRAQRAAWVMAVREGEHPFLAFCRIVPATGARARLLQGEAVSGPLTSTRERVEVWCRRVIAWQPLTFVEVSPRKAVAIAAGRARNQAQHKPLPTITFRPSPRLAGYDPDQDLIHTGSGWLPYDTSELGSFDPHTCHLPPGGHPCE